MKMKKGQTVKYIANEKPGDPKTREWRTGIYQGRSKDQVFTGDVPPKHLTKQPVILVKKGEFSKEVLRLPEYAVKPFERIEDDETVIQFGKDRIKELEKMVRDALQVLMPQFNNDRDVKQDNQEPHLILLNGAITVEPVAVEVESIVGFKEHLGWSVTVWHSIPATRDSPPDVEDAHVGNARTIQHAAGLAVETMFKCVSGDYWTSVAENFEADPENWPCPDGPNCEDPECAKLKKDMDK